MMMRMLLRSARRRQLHTFISKETIKPSSPTPSHLKTYNLSLLDQVSPSVYMPIVFFYPTSCTSSHAAKSAQLKKSLSQTLAQYYPFSGTLVAGTDGAFVDCNDEGVDFLEVQSDARLSNLVHMHRLGLEHQPLDHLFPTNTDTDTNTNTNTNGSAWDPPSKGWGSLVRVQLTYFSCGGIGLAVSMCHKIGDGFTLLTFINHWASINRVNSCNQDDDNVQLPLPPHFDSSPGTKFPSIIQEHVLDKGKNCVTKRFVFPNSKLALLKAAKAKDEHILINPTRIEVLTSLLYERVVSASKANSRNPVKGCVFVQTVNVRKRMAQPLHEYTYMGNIYSVIIVQTTNESELALNSLATRIKNAKMQLMGMTDSEIIQQAIQLAEASKNEYSKNDSELAYGFTSLCGFGVYKINFGWGKPIWVTLPGGFEKNFFILMDTPNGDGIEAIVDLEEEDMAIFQNDDRLLAFAL